MSVVFAAKATSADGYITDRTHPPARRWAAAAPGVTHLH
jgi:hypothetical protein